VDKLKVEIHAFFVLIQRKQAKKIKGFIPTFFVLIQRKQAKKSQGLRFFWEMAPSVLHVALQLVSASRRILRQ